MKNQVVYTEIDSDDSEEEEDEFENADEESGKLFYYECEGHLIFFSFNSALLVTCGFSTDWAIMSLVSIVFLMSRDVPPSTNLVASIIVSPTQILRIDENEQFPRESISSSQSVL